MTNTVVPVFSWLLLILGLSYLMQADTWIRFSRDALANDHTYYILYLLLLIIGLVVITEYNIWVLEWNVVITVAGWSMVIKSAVFLIAPRLMDPFAKLLEMNFSKYWIRVAGLVLTILGTILVYHNVLGKSPGL